MSVFPPNYLYKLFALINMYPLLISLILYLSNTLDFPPNKKISFMAKQLPIFLNYLNLTSKKKHKHQTLKKNVSD